MATTVHIDFTSLTGIPLLAGSFGLANKVPILNNHPFEMFHITADSYDDAVSTEFQTTNLREVVTGRVYDVINEEWMDVDVGPKSDDSTIAVVDGDLEADGIYLVFAIGLKAL